MKLGFVIAVGLALGLLAAPALASELPKRAQSQATHAETALASRVDLNCSTPAAKCVNQTLDVFSSNRCPRVAKDRWRCLVSVQWTARNPEYFADECNATVNVRRGSWRFPPSRFGCPPEWRPLAA